jgi:hypothetical protein
MGKAMFFGKSQKASSLNGIITEIHRFLKVTSRPLRLDLERHVLKRACLFACFGFVILAIKWG